MHIAIFAAMLASCSTDADNHQSPPVIEFSDVPIGFGTTVSRGSHYDSDWSTTERSAFNVTAYYYADGSSTPLSLINDNTVTYNGTSWTYAPTVYWPKNGTVDFFSYAPARVIGDDGNYVTPNARQEFNTFTPSHINHQAILVDCHVPASQITSIHTLKTIGTAESPCPHDASKQYDLMFAFQRNMQCEEQSVTSRVPMNMAHVMSGIKFDVSGLKTATDDGGTLKVPAGTDKIVIGIGRIKTGGTLAICEPAGDPRTTAPAVVWTLDNLEGTFYETYDVEWSGSTITSITREKSGKPTDMVDTAWEKNESYFFFPPQPIETGLTITAYFYVKNTNTDPTDPISYDCTEFRTYPIPTTGTHAISQLERGKIITLNIE